MARTKFSELRDQVVARPGATERLTELRRETLEEIHSPPVSGGAWCPSRTRCRFRRRQPTGSRSSRQRLCGMIPTLRFDVPTRGHSSYTIELPTSPRLRLQRKHRVTDHPSQKTMTVDHCTAPGVGWVGATRTATVIWLKIGRCGIASYLDRGFRWVEVSGVAWFHKNRTVEEPLSLWLRISIRSRFGSDARSGRRSPKSRIARSLSPFSQRTSSTIRQSSSDLKRGLTISQVCKQSPRTEPHFGAPLRGSFGAR
jgi:hypothetical protein